MRNYFVLINKISFGYCGSSLEEVQRRANYILSFCYLREIVTFLKLTIIHRNLIKEIVFALKILSKVKAYIFQIMVESHFIISKLEQNLEDIIVA